MPEWYFNSIRGAAISEFPNEPSVETVESYKSLEALNILIYSVTWTLHHT